MRNALIACCLLALATLCLSVDSRTDEEVVSYAKAISAARLDPALPDRPVEDWLVATIPSEKPFVWRRSDCGERRGGLLCADFVIKCTEDISVWGEIIIGTQARGITGTPRLRGVSVIKGRFDHYERSHRLSDLPDLLRAAERKSR